jgi:hypothetical protein
MAAGHKDSGKTPDRHLTEQECAFNGCRHKGRKFELVSDPASLHDSQLLYSV